MAFLGLPLPAQPGSCQQRDPSAAIYPPQDLQDQDAMDIQNVQVEKLLDSCLFQGLAITFLNDACSLYDWLADMENIQ